MRTRIQFLLAICVLSLLVLPAANAQGTIDMHIGFGAAQAGEPSTGISASTLQSCTLSSDPNCIKRSGLSNFLLGFGGAVMIREKLGFGVDVNLQPGKQDYATFSTPSTSTYGDKLQSRLTLYDFNAVYRPISSKKAALQLTGGIGGANLKYYETMWTAGSVVGSNRTTEQIGSVNKFQMHGGVGVQIYVKDGIFIRPQFDLHYIPNLDRYGTNLIKRETVWIGYTFGK